MAGEPSHFEVGVQDAGRAKAFYGAVLGWSFETTTGENVWIETSGVRGGLHDADAASNIVLYFSVPGYRGRCSTCARTGRRCR